MKTTEKQLKQDKATILSILKELRLILLGEKGVELTNCDGLEKEMTEIDLIKNNLSDNLEKVKFDIFKTFTYVTLDTHCISDLDGQLICTIDFKGFVFTFVPAEIQYTIKYIEKLFPVDIDAK